MTRPALTVLLVLGMAPCGLAQPLQCVAVNPSSPIARQFAEIHLTSQAPQPQPGAYLRLVIRRQGPSEADQQEITRVLASRQEPTPFTFWYSVADRIFYDVSLEEVRPSSSTDLSPQMKPTDCDTLMIAVQPPADTYVAPEWYSGVLTYQTGAGMYGATALYPTKGSWGYGVRLGAAWKGQINGISTGVEGRYRGTKGELAFGVRRNLRGSDRRFGAYAAAMLELPPVWNRPLLAGIEWDPYRTRWHPRDLFRWSVRFDYQIFGCQKRCAEPGVTKDRPTAGIRARVVDE